MLDRLFSLDLRSLALFRVCAACAVLLDLASRWPDLVAHYTNAGVLPTADAAAVFGRQAQLSLHGLLAGSVGAERLLFAVAALAAVAMLLGWRTRLAVALTWLLFLSLHARNPNISNLAGDKFLRIVLFWAIFLPLGARFSLDARRRSDPDSAPPERVFSIASAALILQIALMYTVTGVHKFGELWRGGDAILFALHLDTWTTRLGVWLRQWPDLLRAATHATRWLEILGPLLLFSPVRSQTLRLIVAVVFMAFHVGLASMFHLGLFPLFCIVAWTALLPTLFWRRLDRRLGLPAPSSPGRRIVGTPRWVQGVAGAALVYVMVFLGLDVGRAVAGLPFEMPRTLHRVGATLRINQYWRMFAPDPPDREAWAAIDGRLANGQRLDPLRRAAPLLDKPAAFAGEYPSFRWHLYLLTFAGDGPRHHFAGILRRSLAAYLCRDWNSRHAEDERLVSIRIWRLVEPTRLDGGAEIARDRVFEASCRELAPDPGG